jgi:DNA-directed RNA polymerase subunit K/omega
VRAALRDAPRRFAAQCRVLQQLRKPTVKNVSSDNDGGSRRCTSDLSRAPTMSSSAKAGGLAGATRGPTSALDGAQSKAVARGEGQHDNLRIPAGPKRDRNVRNDGVVRANGSGGAKCEAPRRGSAAVDEGARKPAAQTEGAVQESKRRKQLTRFERAHAIRSRANAIAAGAPVRLRDTQGCTDPLALAERELEAGLLSDYVVRKCYPDGSYEEFGIYDLAHVHR